MNDILLKKLIQQSRAVQGYLSYTPNQLEQALGGWRVGLAELSQDEIGPAFQAAMAAYETGPFNPAFVRKIFYQNHPPSEIAEADAVIALKRLAEEVLSWPMGGARYNILRPIAEWIGRRPKDAPLKAWEKKVLDAVKPKTESGTA